MKVIKGYAYMDKEDAVKGLWTVIDALIKSVKAIIGIHGAGSTRKAQYTQLNNCLQIAKYLEEDMPELGTIVKLGEDTDECWVVGRFEGFREGDENHALRAGITVLAGSEKYCWEKVEDFITIDINRLSDAKVFSLDLLPSLVGSTFSGIALAELMKATN